MAFTQQTGQNHGLQLFCATLFHHNPTLQQKLAMSLQPHRPALFCPLSPEAVLLTGKEKTKTFQRYSVFLMN